MIPRREKEYGIRRHQQQVGTLENRNIKIVQRIRIVPYVPLNDSEGCGRSVGCVGVVTVWKDINPSGASARTAIRSHNFVQQGCATLNVS